MSLGQAFVDVRGDTTGFTPDLQRKLKEALKGIEAKVKVVADTRGLAAQIQRDLRSLSKPIQLKFEAAGLAALRAQVQRELRNQSPIQVKFEAVGLAGLRAQVQRELRNQAAVQVKFEPTGLATLRAQVQREMRSLAPVKVRFLPEGLATLRAQVQREMRSLDAVRVRLQVSDTDVARLAAAIQRQLRSLPPIPIRVVPFVGPMTGTFAPLVASAESAATRIGSVFAAAGEAVKSGLLAGVSGVIGGFQEITKRVLQADAAIGAFGIKGTLDMEQLEAALLGVVKGNAEINKQILSDADATAEVAKQIKSVQALGRLAPTFSFKGLLESSKSLQTLNITGDEAVATVKNLANALAAAGRASDANLQGAITPLLQAASTGKFLGQDLNQLAQRLPGVFNRGKVLETLKGIIDAERTARGETKLTAAEFQKLRESGLPAAQTIRAVLESLNNSPVAKGALERQAKTIRGQIFTIRRAVEQGILGLFEGVRPALSKALDTLGPEVTKVFAPGGPLLSSIRNFVLKAIPILASLIGPVTRVFTSINNVVIKFIDAFGGLFKPAADGIASSFEGIGRVIVGAIDGVKRFSAFLQGDSLGAENIRIILANLGATLANLGPILVNIGTAFRDAFTVFAPILLPLLNVLSEILKVITDIAASPFGGYLLSVAATLGVVLLAISAVRSILIAYAVASTGAAASTALLTLRFVAGAIAAGSFGVALQAVRGAAVAALASLGPVAGTVAALTAAFAVGYFGVLKLGHAFGIGSQEAEKATVSIRLLDGTIREVPRDIAIRFTDNSGQISSNISVLSAQLQQFRSQQLAAGNDLRNLTKSELELAQLRDAQEKAKGKFIGPVIPGQTRPIILPKVPDFSKLLETQNSLSGGNTPASINKAANTAADKAKAAFEKFRDAIQAILDGLNEDFKDGLIGNTAKQIRRTLNDLSKSITKAFDDAGKARPSKLLKTISDENKALQKLAIERDVVADKLKAATDKMVQVRDAVRSFANVTSLDFAKAVNNIVTLDIAGSFRVLSKTTDATKDAIKHSATEIAAALKDRLKSIQAFQADIDVLIKKGVRRSLIDEIIGAGVEGGGATADALAHASSATIAGINKTQDAINAAATKLGNTAAENFFRSGGQIVEGLIAGLKDRKSEIAKEMTDIANSLITAIRKTLKIHSPSKVMRALFNHAGHGAVLGLRDMVPNMLKQSAEFAKAGLPDMAGLQQVHANLTDRRSAGLSEATALRLVSGLEGARPNKEIHAPITQHFHQPPTPQVARSLFATVGRR